VSLRAGPHRRDRRARDVSGDRVTWASGREPFWSREGGGDRERSRALDLRWTGSRVRSAFLGDILSGRGLMAKGAVLFVGRVRSGLDGGLGWGRPRSRPGGGHTWADGTGSGRIVWGHGCSSSPTRCIGPDGIHQRVGRRMGERKRAGNPQADGQNRGEKLSSNRRGIRGPSMGPSWTRGPWEKRHKGPLGPGRGGGVGKKRPKPARLGGDFQISLLGPTIRGFGPALPKGAANTGGSNPPSSGPVSRGPQPPPRIFARAREQLGEGGNESG